MEAGVGRGFGGKKDLDMDKLVRGPGPLAEAVRVSQSTGQG